MKAVRLGPQGKGPQLPVRIVAFNTYDFADGVKRANLVARFMVTQVRLPVWGPFFGRFENRQTLKAILAGGGLHDPCPTITSTSSDVSGGAPDTQMWPGGSTAT